MRRFKSRFKDRQSRWWSCSLNVTCHSFLNFVIYLVKWRLTFLSATKWDRFVGGPIFRRQNRTGKMFVADIISLTFCVSRHLVKCRLSFLSATKWDRFVGPIFRRQNRTGKMFVANIISLTFLCQPGPTFGKMSADRFLSATKWDRFVGPIFRGQDRTVWTAHKLVVAVQKGRRGQRIVCWCRRERCLDG